MFMVSGFSIYNNLVFSLLSGTLFTLHIQIIQLENIMEFISIVVNYTINCNIIFNFMEQPFNFIQV